MASALDVADFVLQKCGTLPAMKLQKLVYYTQAWSLVWDDKTLFNDRIEAWANGPVVPSLYAAHRLQYEVNDIPGGDLQSLNDDQIETVQAVINYYGDKSSQWLSDLTHMEDPWIGARAGLSEGERGNQEITLASMAEYYSSLPPEE